VSATVELLRIHRACNGLWWFSADGSGRFDLDPPRGTCYLAENAVGAWVEVFRTPTLIAEVDVSERRLGRVKLGRRLRLADITSRRALQFGVTASLSAAEDYGPSQAFAAQVLAAGFDGVRYLVRHDPRQRLYAVALFGPAGAPEPTDPAWPHGKSAPISNALVDEAHKAFGYRVLPTP
jgi:hypothetical protein